MDVFQFVSDFTTYQLVSILIYAFLVGWERAGIRASILPAVPLVVQSFGAVRALGLMIPLLVIADIFSVSWYKKSADKKDLIKLIPFAFFGIITALLAGKSFSSSVFNKVIGTLIISSLIIISVNQHLLKKCSSRTSVKGECKNSFAAKTGPFFSFMTGFSSMLGGAGGPIISTYYLITDTDKNRFIGTTAWFFFFVNIMKLPLYLFVWKNITVSSFITDICLLPLTAAGIISGIYIVKRINESLFKIIIFTATLFSAIKLFF